MSERADRYGRRAVLDGTLLAIEFVDSIAPVTA